MKRMLLFFLFAVGLFANDTLDYGFLGYKIGEHRITVDELEKYVDIDDHLYQMYIKTRSMNKIANAAMMSSTAVILIGSLTMSGDSYETGLAITKIGIGSALITLPLGIVAISKHNNLAREYNSLLERQSVTVGYNGEAIALQYNVSF